MADYIVSSGVTSTGVVLSGWDDSMTVLRGGVANSTTLASDCSLEVYSGGTATDTTFNGGRIYVSGGGMISGGNASGSDCELRVESGTVVRNLTIESNAAVEQRGGKTVNTRIFSGAIAYLCGFANDNGNGNGEYSVYPGEMESATVYNGGLLSASSNTKYDGNAYGIVRAATVLSGGSVIIADRSSATHCILSSGGVMTIRDQCKGDNTLICGGTLNVHQGGEADSSMISSRGKLMLQGQARNTTVEAAGALFVGFGGVAENITVTGGVYVATGGEIKGNIDVSGSGALYLYGGSIVDGEIHVKGTLYVDDTMVNNGHITVNLNNASPSVAMLQNLGYMSGTDNFSVEVGSAGTGSYLLASGAGDFSGTVTVEADGVELDDLSIGESVQSGDREYTLNKADDALCMVVKAVVPVTVTKTIAGNFTGTGGAFQLMSDGTAYVRTSDAKTKLAGTVDASQWEIVDAGDFAGIGKDGLLWLEKDTGYAYMQYDMSSLAEITNKTNCLGIVGDGYTLKAAGDFSGSGVEGALLQSPVFGDSSVSLNYGLPVWARESNGTTFNGWLGALVNTWKEGDTLKGDLSDPASINANNYQYKVVGVGDFNGDGRDDVMLQNTMPTTVTQGGHDYTITGSGDVFTFLTGDKAAIIAGDAPTVCYAGCATGDWDILGFGDFNDDGVTDTLLSDGTGLAGWSMVNGQRQSDLWFGNLAEDQEVAGIADFNGDGTDDILIRDTAGTLTAWTVQNGSVTGSLALK